VVEEHHHLVTGLGRRQRLRHLNLEAAELASVGLVGPAEQDHQQRQSD
jgi:hypothetical protein